MPWTAKVGTELLQECMQVEIENSLNSGAKGKPGTELSIALIPAPVAGINKHGTEQIGVEIEK